VRARGGRQAAEEALPEILQLLDGANMVFVTAGMGAAPARVRRRSSPRRRVSRASSPSASSPSPSTSRAAARMQSAEQGILVIGEVGRYADRHSHQNLFKIATRRRPSPTPSRWPTTCWHMGVAGVTDLMVMPGLITSTSPTFARDGRDGQGDDGTAGEGPGSQPRRARERDPNPLLEDHSMKGAKKGVLININRRPRHDPARGRRGGQPHPRGSRRRRQLIFGPTFDATMQGRMRVSWSPRHRAMAAQQPAPNYLSLDMKPADADPASRRSGVPRHRRSAGPPCRPLHGAAARANGRRARRSSCYPVRSPP